MKEITIIEHEILAKHTTFGIGGRARYFTITHDEESLRKALTFAGEQKIPFLIMAGGSNLLFSDSGFDGLVIKIYGGEVKIYKDRVIAEAGSNLTESIRESAEAGLTGWESMCGIPGSVGGAVRGNAGAFGTEVKDVLSKVHAMNITTGEVRDFTNEECEFGYRTSYFKMHPEWVVLMAVFNLEASLPSNDNSLSAPSAKCDEVVAEREKRHLQNVAAAGSFFKNPVCNDMPEVIAQFETDKNTKSRGGKVPAGWLIEQCGLRGIKVGDALCSNQHSNYIVNSANATAEDVLKLSAHIKKSVHEKFGVLLEEEVTIIKNKRII